MYFLSQRDGHRTGISQQHTTGNVTATESGAGGTASASINVLGGGGGATDVTAQFSVSNFIVSFNRGTGMWTQTVSITNNGTTLSNVAFVLDNLNAGWTVSNADGTTVATTPAGSPYKIVGVVGAGNTSTFQMTFTKVGTPVFSYTPRVLDGTPR